MPAVSVVMPVFNGARFLRPALESILAQSFRDFELVVVDDGSTDASPAILARHADPRIRIIRNGRNLGLTPSLNIGLDAVRGSLVARMDADDIAHPERFAVQLRLLRADPRLVAVGTGFEMIDADGHFMKLDVQPLSPRLCRWVGLVRTPILHPSAMFRASLVRVHGLRYDERYPAAEDFEFWSQALQHGEAAVIGRPLMRYRMHAANISSAKRGLQYAMMREISERNILREAPDAAPAEVAALLDLFYAQRRAQPADAAPVARLLLGLLRRFAERHGLTGRERRAAAGLAARWLVKALLDRGQGARDPAVLARLVAVLPPFGLPLLGEAARAAAARLPRRSLAAARESRKRPAAVV